MVEQKVAQTADSWAHQRAAWKADLKVAPRVGWMASHSVVH